MPVIAILTKLPDSDSAFNLARDLVRLRLAACANVLSPATSPCRWRLPPGGIAIDFRIAEGHDLYKGRFRVATAPAGHLRGPSRPGDCTVTGTARGCAEDRVCYAPFSQTLDVRIR